MVNVCACIGCSNWADCDKDKLFYHLPSVITHQSDQTLSEQRWQEWLAAIRRQDIKPDSYQHSRVCFISGKPSQLYMCDKTNLDWWIPSVKLGHSETYSGDQQWYEWGKEKLQKEGYWRDTWRGIVSKKMMIMQAQLYRLTSQWTTQSESFERPGWGIVKDKWIV